MWFAEYCFCLFLIKRILELKSNKARSVVDAEGSVSTGAHDTLLGLDNRTRVGKTAYKIP